MCVILTVWRVGMSGLDVWNSNALVQRSSEEEVNSSVSVGARTLIHAFL